MGSKVRNSGMVLGLLAVVALSAALTTGALQAGSVSTALYSLRATTTNASSVDLDDIQSPIALSGASLIEGNFIASDALNTVVHKGGVDVPAMPATDRIQVEGAVQQLGAVFTEFTTEAQSEALNDLPLLGGAPAVNDAWYFGCDNPCSIVTTDVDTVGVGTWTITYEYWDGTSFAALTNVDDRTAGFTALGKLSASWDMPSNWATRTTTGSSVNSYWGRARVSAFSAITTQPLGSRQRYENGQWWTWIENMDVDTQEEVTLFLGGSSPLVTAHQTFPGITGIITGDAAGLELGDAYSLAMDARLDFSAAGSTTYVLNKTGAISIGVSGSASSPAIGTLLTGASTVSSGDVTQISIPATGTNIVVVAADGDDAATWVSGGGMVSYPVQTVADTANNLSWATNSGIDYFEWIRLDVVSANEFKFDTSYSDFSTGTLVNTQAFTGSLGLAN